MFRKIVFAVTIPFLILVSCQKKEDKKLVNGIYQPELKDTAALFSNRPIATGQFVALFKLKTPALLSSLGENQLRPVINKEVLAAIEKEQTQFIEKVKAQTPKALVLMKYKYVLNAVAIMVTVEDYYRISALGYSVQSEKSREFLAPKVTSESLANVGIGASAVNSALFIGAKAASEKNIKGQNMRVGIIDSGIDYTHAMLGGSGKKEDYASVNPSEPSRLFPNSKVVGGFDFVGSSYSSSSRILENRIPKPDNNPMDELGHGTHVAGTVAGTGDGVNSYDGLAPEAQLFALKVFGKEGSTSDEVVIAAMEYAADPNGDGNIDDRMDVLNLSLGSSYGAPRNMYRLAIKNLTLSGTVVVASAGNEGDSPYIVGAPSISDEAMSVAASVDGMDHNWKFRAIEFVLGGTPAASEFVEGVLGRKISEIESKREKLVYIGLAKDDLSSELAQALVGHVALIDRGEISFLDKVKKAVAAGATGVVMVNNQDGPLPVMSGEPKVGIPAVMISQDQGNSLKTALKSGDVFVQFNSNIKIERPQLVDTITSFSSRGPRSEDSLIKPEITAPGQQIYSAALGTGNLSMAMSGTSMSGPHIAGVMALMKQFYPELGINELKSVVMGTSKTIQDLDNKPYTVSRMGAGRVQVGRALDSALASDVPSLSLGEVRIESKKILHQPITLTNLKPDAVTLKVKWDGHPAIVIPTMDMSFGPRSKKQLGLRLGIDASKIKSTLEEVDGFLKFYKGDEEVFRLPLLAIVRKISNLSAQSLVISSSSEADADGALAELTLVNKSSQPGLAIPMNLIALDDRKYAKEDDDIVFSKACDIQAVGYKIVDGKIYFGFKMYQPLTTWHLCELSVLFDEDGDGLADQELSGAPIDRLEGLPPLDQFASLLLDAKMSRQIRTEYEASVASGKPVGLSYMKAVQDVQPMFPLNHSTVALLSADLAKIKTMKNGQVLFKIASSSAEKYNIEDDDYLGSDAKDWRKMDLTVQGQSFKFSSLSADVAAQSTSSIQISKGFGREGLMILIPTNRTLLGSSTNDDQLDLIKPKFLD